MSLLRKLRYVECTCLSRDGSCYASGKLSCKAKYGSGRHTKCLFWRAFTAGEESGQKMEKLRWLVKRLKKEPAS